MMPGYLVTICQKRKNNKVAMARHNMPIYYVLKNLALFLYLHLGDFSPMETKINDKITRKIKEESPKKLANLNLGLGIIDGYFI